MRESLTILASILIAALTAALVGPLFVDWTQQRAFIEQQLSQAIGARVETRGAIGLVLLPTPRLELGGVSLGEDGAVTLRTGAVRFELAVTALLHGELRFIDASIDQPELRIALDSAGAMPSMPVLPEVQFERVEVKRGVVTLEAPSGPVTVSGLDFQAEVASLNGPFRGSGAFARDGERVGFRFSTGAREGEKLRLKFVSDESAGSPRIDVDGALLLGAHPGFEGPFILSGKRPTPWRAVGVSKLDVSRLALEPVELRLGSEAAPIALGGSAHFVLGSQAQGEIALSARQVDLDKLLTETPLVAGFEQTLRVLLADAAASVPFPLRIELASPATYLGGETITDFSLNARLAPMAPIGVRLSGAGPGRSRILLDGLIETGWSPQFKGQVAGEARDLARLGDWLAPALPQVSNALRSSPLRSVEAAAVMEWSAAGFAAPKLTLKADRSAFSGAAAFTRAIGGERARLFADLTSDALDIDGMPDLSWAGKALAQADMSVSLDAKAIRVARFGEGLIDAGRIRLKLLQDSAGLRLENLSIAGLGGADVTASGEISATEGALDVHVDAQRLVDLAAFARRVAPGPLADGLAARAVSLSPLRLNLNLRAQRADAAEPLRLASLAFDATARGARWQAALKPEGGQLSGKISAETRDAAMLIRQLGVEALPIAGAGGATLSATLAGLPEGYQIDATGLLAGLDLGFQGKLTGSLTQPQAAGNLRLKSTDAAPFLRLIGYGLPDVTQGLPFDTRATVTLGEGGLALTGLSGAVAGVSLNGAIALQKRQVGPKISGALDLERANLPAFTALLLGAPGPARGASWSEARFGPGLAEAPDVDIALKAGQVTIMDGLTASQASLRLALGPGVLTISEMAGTFGQGGIAGGVSLRRDGSAVFLSGGGEVTGQPIPGVWARGSWDGRMDFTATGDSPAALVAGLAGTGAVRLRAVTLPQADPGAPARVMAEAESGRLYISENDFMGALRRELDKAPMAMETRDLEARMAGGFLRLSAPDVSASLDLRRMALEARTELPVGALPRDWNEPTPKVAVVWRGPLATPQREIEAAPFINGLAVRAIARESARIEALEADMRERAFFARRKRGLDFLHRREREVAAFIAEQARLERLRPRADIEKGEMERLIESLPE